MSAAGRSRLLSAAVLALALAAVALAVGLVLDARGAGLTVLMLAPLGGLGLALAHVADARRGHGRALGRRFAIGVGLALALVLLTLVIAVVAMFLSTHDATIAIAAVALAAAVGFRAVQVLARGPQEDVAALRAGLDRVAAGERDVVLRTGADDELAALARAGNRMIAALNAGETARAASEQARRDLVAAVSHDLRTPLTALRLIVEAIDDDVLDPEAARTYLRTLRTHVDALGGLIDDLFELSRLDAGVIEWSIEQVRLADLVDETVAAILPQADAKGVRIVGRIPADLTPARGNPAKLQRVLLNLLQNAIRHTPSDGSVVVLAEPRRDRLEIEVRDSGEGIADHDRARIFEPFYRGGSVAARTDAGSGLGLAIARAIVEAHGGRIWLADGAPGAAADGGAAIRFTLPLAS
ncbi:sensor histidine kinase [Patulibacter defluvii]|uniref:sensor histidine kinase n=1 Tax=Patulibacter defluvii TaxID=3095358 RepID=UPI002A74C134|nr:HAMP domain-containing sensor histidine kinase [Patulibacter sp. DM4]